MPPTSRKRPATLRDALETTDTLAPFGSCDNLRRVSSDVRARPGQKLLRLTFPCGLSLPPLHYDVGGCSLPRVRTDDDGDACVERRPSARRGRDFADFELHVQCSRSSSVKNCGQQVWAASLLLAEYLWSVRHSLGSATVLELGAGLAIPSGCISGFCRQVLVSDCNKVSHVHPFCTVTSCAAIITPTAGRAGQRLLHVHSCLLQQQLHLHAA